jgi:hypothetical protein
MKQNAHNDPSCNNAFFLQETYDTEDQFVDQNEVIQRLFPTAFAERFKQEHNQRKFGTTDIKQIKEQLKKTFIRV